METKVEAYLLIMQLTYLLSEQIKNLCFGGIMEIMLLILRPTLLIHSYQLLVIFIWEEYGKYKKQEQ